MALLIEKTVNLKGGVPVDQLYLRLEYSVNRFGKNLECEIFPYLNRIKYQEDKESIDINKRGNILEVENLKNYYFFNYDNEIDGIDVLSVLHNKLKSELTTDITSEIISRDPSTAEPLTDPSTGEILKTTVISIPKFAEESEVSIVDIDVSIG